MNSRNRKLYQSHFLIARRLRGMIRALKSRTPSDDVKMAIRDLEKEVMEHQRKAMITGDLLISIR